MNTSPVLLFIPVIVPVVIGLLKVAAPRIPKVWLPILCPLLGAFAEILVGGGWNTSTTVLWGLPLNVLIGAISGAAGNNLREIIDQLKKRMDDKPAGTLIKLMGLLAIASLLTGCMSYSSSRDAADGTRERVRASCWMKSGKASNIRGTVTDGAYARTLSAGEIQGEEPAALAKLADVVIALATRGSVATTTAPSAYPSVASAAPSASSSPSQGDGSWTITPNQDGSSTALFRWNDGSTNTFLIPAGSTFGPARKPTR